MATKITIRPNGPYVVEGEVELTDVDGNKVDTTDKPRMALCRCGASVTKPFCDQGTAMARALVLSATKEQVEAGCKQFRGDLPALVAQRRAQKRGDAQAQTDVLEKYGLHKMP